MIVNYFVRGQTIKNENNIVIRMDNRKIISNKPVDIDISLLEEPISKEVINGNTNDNNTNDNNTNDNTIISLSSGDNLYKFSTYTGAPIAYQYTHCITKEVFSVFNYIDNYTDISPLTLTIDDKVITNFQLDNTLSVDNTIVFYKKMNGFKIIRKYTINNNGVIESEIEIDNTQHTPIGIIKLVSQENTLLAKDESEGAFCYNDDEKIIKFVSQNDLILDQTVILKPELTGFQSNFFTQVIMQKDSFYRSYFKKNHKNVILNFTEAGVIKNETNILFFSWYAGPKIYANLDKVDSKLSLIMEYGWFAKISQLFLSFIFLLTSLCNSFGIALILFVFLTKLLFIPFASSIREKKKKTKEFQQRMDYINAKYHDDPEKKNVETMALYKKYGMFPGLSSNIPQLFNFFIVIALQSVLKKTIMLYKLPVGLWLTDATLPDKYYILPIIFLCTMYLNINNMKISPMMKIAALFIFILFIYFFSFWASSVQLFIVLGIVFSYIETTYILN